MTKFCHRFVTLSAISFTPAGSKWFVCKDSHNHHDLDDADDDDDDNEDGNDYGINEDVGGC